MHFKDWIKSISLFTKNIFQFYFRDKYRKGDIIFKFIPNYGDRHGGISYWRPREYNCLDMNYRNKMDYMVINNDWKMSITKEIKMIWARAKIMTVIDYEGDPENWGQSDYWQTSCESREKSSGDCEDQAIATMIELRNLGFPDNALGCVYIAGHVYACVMIPGENDFYCLDNGGTGPRWASYYVPDQGKSVICIFNLYDSIGIREVQI